MRAKFSGFDIISTKIITLNLCGSRHFFTFQLIVCFDVVSILMDILPKMFCVNTSQRNLFKNLLHNRFRAFNEEPKSITCICQCIWDCLNRKRCSVEIFPVFPKILFCLQCSSGGVECNQIPHNTKAFFPLSIFSVDGNIHF